MDLQNSSLTRLLMTVGLPLMVAILAAVFCIITLVLSRRRKSVAWGFGAGLSLLIFVAGGITAALGVGKLIGQQIAEIQRPRLVTSEDGRHRITVPWSWKNDADLNEQASISVSNRFTERYLILLDDWKADYDGTLRDFAEASAARIAEGAENPEIGPQQPLKIGENPALRCRITARQDGMDVVYILTCVELPDAFAQILCWTLAEREASATRAYYRAVATYTYQPGPPAPPSRLENLGADAPAANRVRALITDLLGIPEEKLTNDARLPELGADDLDQVELVMALEEEFKAEILDEEAARLQTVGDIIRWAERQAAPAGPPAAGEDAAERASEAVR